MTELAVHIVIQGRVQGVAYRAWTVQEARRRGLAGWVRNLRDGNVEAVLQGPEHEVEMMIIACRRGPPLAHVSDIVREPFQGKLEQAGFVQLPTA
jgi:acylphosphatase